MHLEDGSQIELNTDTRLAVRHKLPRSANRLAGPGARHFSTSRHDEDHPFVVRAAGHRLTDLGTKFFVRADKSHIRVALMEGAIRLESDGSFKAQRATLVPGDVAIADAETLAVEKKSGPNCIAKKVGGVV